jgi:hypothetical protein
LERGEDLKATLDLLTSYFNETRAHQGLASDTPAETAAASRSPIAKPDDCRLIKNSRCTGVNVQLNREWLLEPKDSLRQKTGQP